MKSELEVEKTWIHVDGLAQFTKSGFVYIQIRNTSDKLVCIESIECIFESEEFIDLIYIPKKEVWIELKPNELSSSIPVEVKFDLSFKSSTNSYFIRVKYDNKIFEYSSNLTKVLINTLSPPTRNFFISHVDPLDTEIGRRFSSILFKLGYFGYLAEDDRRPGLDLWKDKIIPSIKDTIGTVILYTENAEKDSKNILRELEISKKYHKPIILVLEPNVTSPPEFPSKLKEYYRLMKKITPRELIALSERIHETYKSGDYSKKIYY